MTERVVAGRYRLLSELGRGGMGVVWRARDEVLGREVAVKEVRAPAGLDEASVQQLYARLEQEGRAAARVDHPNVVTVYDVAMAEGHPWIVMELVRGLALSDVLEADGPVSPRRAAEIGGRVLAALRVAHERGVLHRDVKPGNVLIGNDGRIVLTDFGIAAIEGTSAITLTGEVVGSPEYLSPERALGRPAGPGSDLWSLGVLLYTAVEGGSPFRRTTALSTLRAVVDEPLPPPQRAGPLAPVIEGLLRKEPADRLDGADAQRMLDAVAAGRAPYTPTIAGPPTPVPSPSLPPSPPPATGP
jgi:serine/threonine protein kinase